VDIQSNSRCNMSMQPNQFHIYLKLVRCTIMPKIIYCNKLNRVLEEYDIRKS